MAADTLDDAATLPEAIDLLRERYGSDEKLGQKLGTSRQTVIRWRKHGAYPEDFVDALLAEGVPPHLLIREVSPEEIDQRLRQIEAEVVAIRKLIP